jgi:phosphoribosylaminoimidazole-succinocarboxamide synthase
MFDLGNTLLFVASDRISAFDCVLPTGIPLKGHILNQLSAWWFSKTAKLVPNHVVTTDVSQYPASLKTHEAIVRGRSMIVRKAEVLPVECVARGYLIGSGWKEYGQSGAISGIQLRKGYRMADQLDEPIFTPARKAETGHDENISYEEVAKSVGAGLAAQLKEKTLSLYKFAADYALEKGIIIADTKFEFGLVGGQLIVLDEMLTPDSSRFWPAASYTPGQSPPSFDKQFVRDYLETLKDWNKAPPAPPLPDDVIAKTRDKYLEAFRRLTGRDPEV